MSPTGILNTIDAAITGGGLGGTKGVRLLADMAVRMTGNGIVSDYLMTHLPGYVTGGAVSLADVVAVGQAVATESGFQGHGALVSASLAGNLVDLAGGASTAVTQIRTWVTGGALSGERGVAALLGVIAQENGIQAARFQADPNASYQVVTARTDAAFAAAKAEILSMISAGRVTGATVAADLQALGGLSSAQSFGLLIDLARTGDSATQAAVATMLVGMGTKWGPASDPFFSGALIQAAKDFAAVVGGTMSVGAAIADVKAYAKANGASTDAGLVMLGSLLGQYDFVTNAPGSRRAPVDTELTNRIAVGDMAAELAGRVAQGTTPFVPAFGAQPQPTDPSAISYADAKALLSRMVDQYATSHTAADALFAMDVSISQIARTASFNWDSIPGRVLTELQRGLTYTGLSSATINTINSTQIAGYAYDQALAALVDRLGSSTAPTAAGNAAQVRDILSRRLMTGVAATDLVNQVANGTMTTDQVKAAVDKLLAPVVAGLDADSAALMRKTAFGWLAIKSSQYIEGNYQIVTNADGTKSQTYLQSPVNDLFSMLLGEVRDDALAGLGAITSIQNKAMVSAADLATGFKVVQTIYSNIASSVVSTFSNLGNSDVVKAASDAAQAAIRAAAPLFEAGWTAMQGQWDKSAGSQGLPGVLHDEVVANPKDYKGYIDLGAQLAATGVPGGGLFKLTNISGNIWNELAGNGAATAVMVVSVGSKVMTAILGINAVSNALGSAAPALKGVFNVTGATADLLGNVVAGVVKAEAQTYAKAAIDLGTSFANLGTGNFSGLQSSAGDVAKGLFTLTSGGFSPEDLGAVASNAGAAIVDLMSGNPKDAGAAARALGESALKALTGNVYLSAAKDAVLRYADTIANDLFSAAAAAIDFFNNLIHNPKVVSSSPQTLIKDLANIAAVGFKDPKSLSNYGNFYHGSAVDGYLAGATVFVDANGNGVLDAGEYSTTTDNNGAYSLPAGLIGPIVITGGTDTGTGLANPAAYTAPAGSAIVSPLTTLVQKVAQATGDTSSAGIEAAKRSVATAVGLSSGTDLLSLDPEAGALQGDTAATAAFQAGAALINIVTLIGAAGGSAAGQSVFANLATQIAGGATVNLTDGAAVNGLAASLATSAGLSSAAASAIGSIAGASTSALAADLAGANSATARYTLIISAALATQTAGARAVASAAASGMPRLLPRRRRTSRPTCRRHSPRRRARPRSNCRPRPTSRRRSRARRRARPSPSAAPRRRSPASRSPIRMSARPRASC
ncbi:hypothetical protein [Methyloraptor flagellatus]|uniref:Phage tail tape measure protein n=1 Tax=Methyloraptor flagellatus TaxID=3162530 RepID=A0AAU7XCC7_9HYPH